MQTPIEARKEAEDKIIRLLDELNILEKNLIYRQLNRADHITLDGIDNRVDKYAKELADRSNSMAIKVANSVVQSLAPLVAPVGGSVCGYCEQPFTGRSCPQCIGDQESLASQGILLLHPPKDNLPPRLEDLVAKAEVKDRIDAFETRLESLINDPIPHELYGILHYPALEAEKKSNRFDDQTLPVAKNNSFGHITYLSNTLAPATNFVQWTFSPSLGGWVMTFNNNQITFSCVGDVTISFGK